MLPPQGSRGRRGKIEPARTGVRSCALITTQGFRDIYEIGRVNAGIV